MKTHSKVDNYLKNAQPFALPILEYLRELMHNACPEVEEDFKWSFPAFMYKGSILCNMAAFKNHCAFGFWLAPEMQDPEGLLKQDGERDSMGHLGKITCLEDLPSEKILIWYIQHAMELTDMGVKLKKKPKPEKTEIEIPEVFLNRLKENKKALSCFENFSASCQREYVQWIAEAKTEPTREKRIAQTMIWLEEGKKRNWKYEKC